MIALGNIASRALGLARDTAMSYFFGAGAAVDAYTIATNVPRMFYDLLTGGMVDSALVPVFSAYAEREDRDALWGLVSTLLSLLTIIISGMVAVLFIFSPQIAALLNDNPQADLTLTTQLLRITVPAILFLSLSGVISGLLYALKRFAFPAFTAAIFNAVIVIAAVLLHERLGVVSMALGLLIGAAGQVLLQLPGLPDVLSHLRLSLKHPGLRQVMALYAPVLLGLLVEILIIRPFSYRFAAQTGVGGNSWMYYATTIRQLPQGLVAIAVSFAILPMLSAQAARSASDPSAAAAFSATLARGLRLVAVLIIPATVGLFVLGQPVIRLVFEHGDFMPFDTLMTTVALHIYLIGLPFAAIDLLLIFAFYARQNSLTPALVGIAANAAYILVAVALVRPLGLFALMAADSFKLLMHAVISGLLLRGQVGSLKEHGVSRTVILAVLASLAMGAVVFVVQIGIRQALPTTNTLVELAEVSAAGLLGAVVYFGLMNRLGIQEVGMLWQALRQKFSL